VDITFDDNITETATLTVSDGRSGIDADTAMVTINNVAATVPRPVLMLPSMKAAPSPTPGWGRAGRQL
jgi:hypothetical protein